MWGCNMAVSALGRCHGVGSAAMICNDAGHVTPVLNDDRFEDCISCILDAVLNTSADFRDWVEPYRQDLTEVGQPIELVVKGTIPASVRGWYFRNGPAKFSVGSTSVAHPFDGDGAICKINFTASERATLLIQYVKTEGLIAESAACRQMSRGSFGTNIEGGVLANAMDVVPKNPANIAVLWLSGRLFALFEGGQPYELDPHTLHTINCSSLDGLLKIGAPFAVNGAISSLAEGVLSSLRLLRQRQPCGVRLGGDAFASHYRRDPTRHRVVCMSYQVVVDTSVTRIGEMHTDMRFYEFDDASGAMKLLTVKNVQLPGYAFVHDFAITDKYIVVMLNPLKLHLGDYVLGKLSPIHSLEYNPSKRMQVYVIPRQLETSVNSAAHVAEAVFGWPCEVTEQASSVTSCSGVQIFSLRPHFAQHIANAWTTDCDDGEDLHIQYVGYPEMPDFMSWSGPGQSYEHIDPDSQPASRLMQAVFRMPAEEALEQMPKAKIQGPGLPMRSAVRPSETADSIIRPCELESKLCVNTEKLDGPGTVHSFPDVPKELPPSVLFSNSGMTRVLCSRVLEFPQAIGTYDCLTGQCNIWTRGWRYYVGEPEMVPSQPQHRRDGVPVELDGWLLSICYDAERQISEVIILDAANITEGPVATIMLPFVIPHGLHGTFVPDCEIEIQ